MDFKRSKVYILEEGKLFIPPWKWIPPLQGTFLLFQVYQVSSFCQQVVEWEAWESMRISALLLMLLESSDGSLICHREGNCKPNAARLDPSSSQISTLPYISPHQQDPINWNIGALEFLETRQSHHHDTPTERPGKPPRDMTSSFMKASREQVLCFQFLLQIFQTKKSHCHHTNGLPQAVPHETWHQASCSRSLWADGFRVSSNSPQDSTSFSNSGSSG